MCLTLWDYCVYYLSSSVFAFLFVCYRLCISVNKDYHYYRCSLFSSIILTSVVMVQARTVRSPIARLMMKMFTRLLMLYLRLHVSTTMMTTLPSNVASRRCLATWRPSAERALICAGPRPPTTPGRASLEQSGPPPLDTSRIGLRDPGTTPGRASPVQGQLTLSSLAQLSHYPSSANLRTRSRKKHRHPHRCTGTGTACLRHSRTPVFPFPVCRYRRSL